MRGLIGQKIKNTENQKCSPTPVSGNVKKTGIQGLFSRMNSLSIKQEKGRVDINDWEDSGIFPSLDKDSTYRFNTSDNLDINIKNHGGRQSYIGGGMDNSFINHRNSSRFQSPDSAANTSGTEPSPTSQYTINQEVVWVEKQDQINTNYPPHQSSTNNNNNLQSPRHRQPIWKTISSDSGLDLVGPSSQGLQFASPTRTTLHYSTNDKKWSPGDENLSNTMCVDSVDPWVRQQSDLHYRSSQSPIEREEVTPTNHHDRTVGDQQQQFATAQKGDYLSHGDDDFIHDGNDMETVARPMTMTLNRHPASAFAPLTPKTKVTETLTQFCGGGSGTERVRLPTEVESCTTRVERMGLFTPVEKASSRVLQRHMSHKSENSRCISMRTSSLSNSEGHQHHPHPHPHHQNHHRQNTQEISNRCDQTIPRAARYERQSSLPPVALGICAAQHHHSHQRMTEASVSVSSNTTDSTWSTDSYDEPWDMRHKRRIQELTSARLLDPSQLQGMNAWRGQSECQSGIIENVVVDSNSPSLTNNNNNNTRQTNNSHFMKQLVDINRPLDHQLWFHGSIRRREAEQVLHNSHFGDFLVRRSESNPSAYSLSIRHPMGYLHMIISMFSYSDDSRQTATATTTSRSSSTTIFAYILGEHSQPFTSVPEMVRHYQQNILPVRGVDPITLHCALPRLA